MNVIKNEKGTFIELPRESITFCGNTEEEKKANELIFDLSLENDGLQQELERYKNIVDELEKYLEQEYLIVKANSIEEPNNPEWYIKWNERKNILNKLKELKGE